MDRACSTHGEKNACTISMEKPEGERPPGIPRCRLENTEMDLTEDGVLWSGLI
jgi:hypothetical protein